MRTLLFLSLALLVLPGCDSDPTMEPPEEEVPVGVSVRYQVNASGTVPSVTVTYTDANGELRSEAVDFERTTSYTREITLAPGTEGTFSIQASGLVTTGAMTASVTASRVDDGSEIAFDDDAASTTETAELSVSADAIITVVI